MFIVHYRWRVIAGREPDFERAWHARTEKIKVVRGSFGSLLYRDDDGTYCALALWPSRRQWETTEPPLPDDERDARTFAESVERAFPAKILDVLDDRWALPLPEGYTDLLPGKMANVVTCLEMRSPATPAAMSGDVTIEAMKPVDLERYRMLFMDIGAPYLWFSRLAYSDARLSSIVNDPNVEVFAARDTEGDAGILELDFRTAEECEIVFLGLAGRAIGRGNGRALMNFAIDRAWSRPIHRLWVHTCTFDHPGAVDFYVRSGFTPYKRQIEIHPDPRTNGLLPETAAPGIPII